MMQQESYNNKKFLLKNRSPLRENGFDKTIFLD